MSHEPETSAASSRTSAPSRRTILTGAAWSVPVIAAASIAPMASASGVTALAFDKASYSGTACGTITGAYVTVTVGGVPTAGQSVTVTLSGGYTFSGGAATYTGASDGSGKVSLPSINVPAVGGSQTLSAVALGATSSSASVIAPVPASSAARYYDSFALRNQTPGQPLRQSFSDVAAGATAVGYLAFLAPNGELRQNGGLVANGVTSATAHRYDDATGAWHNTATYVDASGAHYYDANGPVRLTFSDVPAGSQAIGYLAFLSSTGDLRQNGTLVATGVTSATAHRYDDTTWHNTATYVDASGGHYFDANGPVRLSYNNVPAGSKAVGYLAFITPSGDLVLNGTVVDSGVLSATAQRYDDATWHNTTTYVTASGGHYYDANGSVRRSFTVPSGSKAVGHLAFLAPNGDLSVNGTSVDTGVLTASAQHYDDSTTTTHNTVTYTTAPAC
ncbi:hypothetical protein [Microbacterium proteolyticum]|uniref:hypothetical protein n=1 Tax=Microbacterium proteolyticum TaxID=1572644 RepID=UPI0024164A4D|nr:hypothetical protein [Microbacterium proteolyticum]